MFGWLGSLLGFEPIKPPPPLDSPRSNVYFESSLDKKDWPEGSQLRKHIQFFEPDGWAHSNWAWRSNGYIDHSGSLHPKLDKAECRQCLGVLKCGACGKIIRPCTKSADMNAQLARKCLECSGELLRITCEARTHHFVVEENGSRYSVWEHIGSHSSHPRPPIGRRPPRSVPSRQVAHTRARTLAHKPNITSVAAQGLFHSILIEIR
jgi:hypothetical protein